MRNDGSLPVGSKRVTCEGVEYVTEAIHLDPKGSWAIVQLGCNAPLIPIGKNIDFEISGVPVSIAVAYSIIRLAPHQYHRQLICDSDALYDEAKEFYL